MKKYDVIVIGSGCGLIIVEEAVSHGLKVALVDKGPLGGTCSNVGCIPSKMLIFAADRITELQEAKKLGIEADIKSINFNFIMERMRKTVSKSRKQIRQSIIGTDKLDYYEGEGQFTDEYTIKVNGQTIKGDKIFIAAGSRPLIPTLKGLEDVDYLTNESALELKERPPSLIIIGGGYVAVEFGHFFAAMGTKVTILEMADRLVLAEEPEISALLKKELSRRMDVYTGVRAKEVKKNGNKGTVTVDDVKTGREKQFTAQKIMIAVGRRSNADLLKLENTGVAVDKRGFIKVNKYLETKKKNIYAVGDINGQQMFTHVANLEATLVIENALHGSKTKMDYSAAPHAVYSHPQIASVGLTEESAGKTHKILVGRAKYSDTAQGEAMVEKSGFAKAVVEEASNKILGFHIIGPYAPILIQEVIDTMASGGTTDNIFSAMHIHPAIPELIPEVLSNLKSPATKNKG
ncbi:MAG: dihydrolipoyl dehydrogenase [Chloroflexi bacterium RBG_13_51_18]|nr:MAG: dihydrolipoyl dehydrogenase [Chloroflexi bacterium RBG_13_51_18]